MVFYWNDLNEYFGNVGRNLWRVEPVVWGTCVELFGPVMSWVGVIELRVDNVTDATGGKGNGRKRRCLRMVGGGRDGGS